MPPMPSDELTRVLAAASPAEGRRWSGDGGCRHGGARKPLPHAGGAGCAPRRLPQLGCRRWLTCAWGVWHAARPRRELAHVTAGRLAVAGWMGRGACLPRADVCVSHPCVAGQAVSPGMPQNRPHCWSRRHVSTPVGFEPTRGDPVGLAGRRLSRSAKVSLSSSQSHCAFEAHSAPQ